MKIKLSFIFLVIVVQLGFSQATIEGRVIQPNWQVNCYEPIQGYFNPTIAKSTFSDSSGYFKIKLDLPVSGQVKLSMGNYPIWLMMDPGDKIWVENDSMTTYKGLIINGNNAAGNLYYNQVFNEPIMEKFNKVDAVIPGKGGVALWDRIEKVLDESYYWVDSLFQLGLVSESFAELSKANIIGTLGWHINMKSDQYKGFESSKNYILGQLIKKANIKNPDNFKTRGGTNIYTSVYLKLIADLSPIPLEKEKHIFKSGELQNYSLAPTSIQPHIFFKRLIGLYDFGADEDYCYAYQQYQALFPDATEYLALLSTFDFCDEQNHELEEFETEFFKTKATNIETLINDELIGQRWYVDFWATWCLPCINLIRNTPDNFDQLLDQYNIIKLFISIDEDEEKWLKFISKNEMKGKHLRLSGELNKSFMDFLNIHSWFIPRFLIISEEGKVINKNAPRPIDLSIIEAFKELGKD